MSGKFEIEKSANFSNNNVPSGSFNVVKSSLTSL
jgi:hypothetical protein